MNPSGMIMPCNRTSNPNDSEHQASSCTDDNPHVDFRRGLPASCADENDGNDHEKKGSGKATKNAAEQHGFASGTAIVAVEVAGCYCGVAPAFDTRTGLDVRVGRVVDGR